MLTLNVSRYPPRSYGPNETTPSAGSGVTAEVYQADVGTDEVGGIERGDRGDRPVDVGETALEQQRDRE